MATAALRLVEGSPMDKSKALDAALSQIERNFGKGSIMRLGKNPKSMDVETVPTGSLGLDIALGIGGLPRGRVVEVYGPPVRLAEVENEAAAAGLRTRRTGTSISILGVDGSGSPIAGERRPANLEDVFVLLTGEEID